MTASEREAINAVIATLEDAYKAADGRGKSTYSQGRALPSTANQIQDAIIRLNALLTEDDSQVKHVASVITANADGVVEALPVVTVTRKGR